MMMVLAVGVPIYFVIVVSLFLGYGKARAAQERERLANWRDEIEFRPRNRRRRQF